MNQSLQISRTKNLPNPNEYVLQLDGVFREWAFNEDRGPEYKGHWRELAFSAPTEAPLDLEIGTGNGLHFAHLAQAEPSRLLVGIEVKYKPLIQSIRRAVRSGSKNARVVRYDASLLSHLFADQELDNVYIHFPDPWEKKRQWKHRLINESFLEQLSKLQKPGCFIDFKTDSSDYFAWVLERIPKSPYALVGLTKDLHQSQFQAQNFVTHFESLFIRQGQPINFLRLTNKG